jgi:hypothetical protein
MFLFLRLVLGHLIGDFLLQTDRVYALKHKGLKGGLPHALLVSASCLAMAWPYLNLPGIWVFILLMGCLHLLQDSIKIGYARFTRYSFWLYILDQCFHIGIISTIFLTGLKNLPAPAPSNAMVSLYNNDLLIVYLIALIAATYNGFFLIRVYKLTYMAHSGQYTKFEKWYGMVERALIVTFCSIPRSLPFFIPLLFARLALFSLSRKKRFAHRSFIKPGEMSLSWVIGITIGVLLYLSNQQLYKFQ